MPTDTVLEKRIQTLKNRLRKHRDAAQEAPSPPRLRKIRKRLKHNQRKLRTRISMQKKATGQKGEPEAKTV